MCWLASPQPRLALPRWILLLCAGRITAYTGRLTIPLVFGVVGGRWGALRLRRREICENAGSVFVVVRGTDNGIYLKSWSSGVGWSAFWVSPTGGGATKDTPACAYLNGVLFVVVRGTNNELYWSFNGASGWVDLNGASASRRFWFRRLR